MKTTCFAVVLAAAGMTALAQVSADPATVNNARVVASASARDGFTRANAETLLTRKGVTEKITRGVVMPNGLRVFPDGTAILPNGTKIFLRSNQILTLEGVIEDTPLTPAGTAPLASGGSPSAGAKVSTGIAVLDGITGTDRSAFITRGGITQQVSTNVRLESGILVQPNGTIILANGSRVTLQPGQRLTFEGVLQDAPRR